ncbi:MAG: DNA-binding protein [endosymbiont of Galathealinum brachiosum]|uniref:DNA-binding protein n=1 Tax=endosymbiont of Galathealinum brachiosum TaxID=2200906 RepID=A0A370DM93_9GAMM|nr:MAG: DNA-binding protein [endosymbiont of Galathealinum brachiosum]
MTDSIKGKTYLTPSEVADLLMVSSAAIRRWAALGELKALTTPGGHRRFLPEHVKEFAKSRNIVIDQNENEIEQGIRVLVVDDDKQFSGYLMKMLGRYPGKLLPELAENGFEAGIKVHDFNPDVVLLDLMMPGMDGFQVCEQLKSDDQTQDVRVIAMTGYPSASNTKNILQAGAEVCLPKPINRKVLLKHLGLKLTESA